MNLKDAQFELRSALLGTGMVQPVSTGVQRGKVSTVWALCRQMPRQEKAWLRVVEHLLRYANEYDIDLHLCRRYVLKSDALVFGWHLSVSGPAKSMPRSLQGVAKLLEGMKPDLAPHVEDVPSGRGALPGVAPFADPTDSGSGRIDVPASSLARPPSPEARVQPPPPGFTPQIKVVHSSVDEETGRPFVIEEMPLPHVYQEMNRPTHPGGRGAKYLGGGGTK